MSTSTADKLAAAQKVRESLYTAMCGPEREEFNAALMAFAPEEAGHHFLKSATRMVKRAEKAERDLAEQAARLRDEIARRQEVVRANRKLDLEERDQLRDQLRAELARRALLGDGAGGAK